MWVSTTGLPTSASHPFYRRLNQLLREHGFDDVVEAQCAGLYAETMDRLGLPRGIYLRLLLIGYFEGIDSERGIAWRAAGSLALRDFLGLGLHDVSPDHSTISRTRCLIASEAHRAVFTWIAQCLGNAGLIKGKTSTTRELLERPCAHLYETGGLRRAHVRGHKNVPKRCSCTPTRSISVSGGGASSASAPRALSRAARLRLRRCSARCGRSCAEDRPEMGSRRVTGVCWALVDCFGHVG